jgi:hypothetical protein
MWKTPPTTVPRSILEIANIYYIIYAKDKKITPNTKTILQLKAEPYFCAHIIYPITRPITAASINSSKQHSPPKASKNKQILR